MSFLCFVIGCLMLFAAFGCALFGLITGHPAKSRLMRVCQCLAVLGLLASLIACLLPHQRKAVVIEAHTNQIMVSATTNLSTDHLDAALKFNALMMERLAVEAMQSGWYSAMLGKPLETMLSDFTNRLRQAEAK